jgi:acyl carrier protein
MLREFLTGPLGCPTTIESDTPLIESGYLDSIKLMELAMFLQDTFGLDLDPGDFASGAAEPNFGSIGRIVGYLQAKLPAERAS